MRIGVDLGGTKIEAVVLSDDGTERARERIESPRDDYDATIHAVVDLITRISNDAGCEPDSTIGIGIPGAMSTQTGVIKNANSTWLIGHPFDLDLERALDRPVRIANDANCFTVSEAVDGAGREYGMVFGVILGTGVGGGIAIDRRTHAGLNAIAGEWGHNPLPWPQDIGGMPETPGPECYCGERGCIETFLSGSGLSNDYAFDTGEMIDARQIAARASSGDTAAKDAIARYTHRLARSLASVINILDPDAVVFGGGLSNLPTIYQRLPDLIGQHVFSDSFTTPCLPNHHGDSSGVRGAAWLWPPMGTA